jgi:hypothetical protein
MQLVFVRSLHSSWYQICSFLNGYGHAVLSLCYTPLFSSVYVPFWMNLGFFHGIFWLCMLCLKWLMITSSGRPYTLRKTICWTQSCRHVIYRSKTMFSWNVFILCFKKVYVTKARTSELSQYEIRPGVVNSDPDRTAQQIRCTAKFLITRSYGSNGLVKVWPCLKVHANRSLFPAPSPC